MQALLLLLMAARACSKDTTFEPGDEPKFVSAKVSASEGERMVKLSYIMTDRSGASKEGYLEHEVCVNCELDAITGGMRVGETGSVRRGAICGWPKGCYTINEPEFGTTLTVAFRDVYAAHAITEIEESGEVIGADEIPATRAWSPQASLFLDPSFDDGKPHELPNLTPAPLVAKKKKYAKKPKKSKVAAAEL